MWRRGESYLEQLKLPACLLVAVMSVVSFFLFGADKRRAERGEFRIRERTLLLCALLGGPGALLGMRLFRHKTRKPLFRFFVPVFFILDAILLLKVTT
jgi:uncharacterized membrane protein YsdA (DUF1294 family)